MCVTYKEKRTQRKNALELEDGGVYRSGVYRSGVYSGANQLGVFLILLERDLSLSQSYPHIILTDVSLESLNTGPGC